MSNASMGIVLHHSPATGTAKTVLIGIADHDGDGGSWPSIATLAKYARVDERSVQRAITKLEKAGQIRVHIRGGMQRDGRYRTNRFEILVRCPDDCDGTNKHTCDSDFDDQGELIEGHLRGLPSGDASVTPKPDPAVTPVSPLAESSGDAGVVVEVTPASPEPSFNQLPPLPPASGGRSSSTTCTKPGPTPHANCRGCKTTNRDLAEVARIQAEADRREAERMAVENERAAAKLARQQGRTPATEAELERTRELLRSSR